MLVDILKQNNVDCSGVRFDPNARTALAFVTLRADGEREFLFFRHPSADMLLTERELEVKVIEQASLVFLSREIKLVYYALLLMLSVILNSIRFRHKSFIMDRLV